MLSRVHRSFNTNCHYEEGFLEIFILNSIGKPNEVIRFL